MTSPSPESQSHSELNAYAKGVHRDLFGQPVHIAAKDIVSQRGAMGFLHLMVWALLGVLVAIPLSLLLRGTGVPRVAIQQLTPAAFLVAGAISSHLGKRKPRPTLDGYAQSQGDATTRLRLIGRREDALDLLARVEDVPFEPMVKMSLGTITFVNDPRPQPGAGFLSRYGVRVLMFVVAYALVAGMNWTVTRQWNYPTSFDIWASMALGIAGCALAEPRYVRLAPGVLDVFWYPPLGRGTPRVRRFNLATAVITLRLVDSAVIVRDPADDFTIVISHRAWWARWPELPERLLAAATTSHPTPPMPQDELSG